MSPQLETLFSDGILVVDPSEQLKSENAAFEAMMAGMPNPLHVEHLQTDDQWQALRTQMLELGKSEGVLPAKLRPWLQKAEELEENIVIPGPAGDLPVQLIKPVGEVRGALLHTHGGGWISGESAQFGHWHAMAAEQCGLLVAGVDYRLAPQAPYPAALDDCEAAALWLIDRARAEYGVEPVFVRGESAGGHLALTTAMRLKNRHGYRFRGVISEVPLTDFTNGLPSRLDGFGVDAEACRQIADAFIPDRQMRRDPDASPAYASVDELRDMPPALFVCGERDGLRDDALLMFMRWRQSGNAAFITIFNGAGHNCTVHNSREAELAWQIPIEFMRRCLLDEIGGPGEIQRSADSQSGR